MPNNIPTNLNFSIIVPHIRHDLRSSPQTPLGDNLLGPQASQASAQHRLTTHHLPPPNVYLSHWVLTAHLAMSGWSHQHNVRYHGYYPRISREAKVESRIILAKKQRACRDMGTIMSPTRPGLARRQQAALEATAKMEVIWTTAGKTGDTASLQQQPKGSLTFSWIGGKSTSRCS